MRKTDPTVIDGAADRPPRPTFLHDDVTCLTGDWWACLAGWKRAAITYLAAPGVAVGLADSYLTAPAATIAGGKVAAGALAYGALHTAAQRARGRRFHATYTRPIARALAGPLGEDPHRPGRFLEIDPGMAGLAGRLTPPMSPAETAVRAWYGRHVQPVLTWAPDQVMRAGWWAWDHARPVRTAVERFRTPGETHPPACRITVRAGWAGRDRREAVREIVPAKLGLSDLVESWDQVGRVAVVTYTVRERPPASVDLDAIRAHLAGRAEHEFVVGLTTGGRPVVVSLDDDAPHLACSAGSGAGKSVLAKLIGMQVLARGGRVVILDRKGSHRWARDLPGVTYCTRPAAMHATLVELAELADTRNDRALSEDEGWDPGQRVFVIFEEMNATVAQLRQWWETERPKGGPKTSPAVAAFREIMFMGRSAKINLFAVAQMLTANTAGGPEARENFGVRALARYTANNWRMLVPECPMPRKSRVRGRWQFVVAGEATETQVAYVSDRELWEYLRVSGPHTHAEQAQQVGTPASGDTGELLTLREAVDRYCPGISLDTIKKRRSRQRARGGGPRPARVRGRDELYDPTAIQQWLSEENSSV